MSAIRPAFTAGSDGTVDARLGPGWQAFEDTLADAVGTRPPTGSSLAPPSVFWIDRALTGASMGRPADGVETVLVEGNASQLVRQGDMIVARSLYDLWDDQAMPVDDFRWVLTLWRNHVLPLYRASDGSYEIEPRWKEEVVYWEGPRGWLLDAGWGVHPPVLYIPPPAIWDSVVPAWLLGRCAVIVSRLTEHSQHLLQETAEAYATAHPRDLRR